MPYLDVDDEDDDVVDDDFLMNPWLSLDFFS